MSKELTIIDKDYIRWVEDLSVRYRQSQIRTAVRVNRELLKYYWELGRDIEEMRVEERWGEKVIKNLSGFTAQKSQRHRPFSNQYILRKEILSALFSVSKSCPTSCGTITRWKSATTCGRIFEVCPTNCGTIGRDAFLHTLGASPLLDGQVQ